jgi:hypothetical protein
MTGLNAMRVSRSWGGGGRRFASAMAVVALAGLMLAGPATATTAFRDRYSFDYSFSYPCGSVDISVQGHTAGVFQVRVGKGSFDTAFFAHNNYAFSETHTNPDGDVLVISGNGLFQETRAVPLGNNQFAFSSVNSGQPFIVRDADGNLLVRDRGTIRETIVFDTQGDDVVGGIFVEELSFKVAGPHDGLGFDTCDILG